MNKYKNESMVDVAYDVCVEKQRELYFHELYKEVCKKMELSSDEANRKMSAFYTNLTLDGRFVNLGDNQWDLRENQKYDKVHIDMNDVYTEMEEESIANRDMEEYDNEEKIAAGIVDDDEDKDDVFDANKEDM